MSNLPDPALLKRDTQADVLAAAMVPTLVAQKLNMRILECDAKRCIMTAPVEGNTQSALILHGGVTCVLVEEAASRAANVHAGPHRRAVGVDINVTHLKAVKTGQVTATATACHLGNSVATYTVEVHNDAGQLTATGRLTLHIINRPTV